MMGERAIRPMRAALVAQRLEGLDFSDDLKSDMLAAALPGAERAAALCPWSAEYPELVARAYIHLGDGHAPQELEQARLWLERSLENRAGAVGTIETLQAVEQALALQGR